MPNVTLILVGILQPSRGGDGRVDEFLSSFSRAFQAERSSPRAALLALAVIVAAAAAAALAWRLFDRWQSARADAAALAHLAQERGLTEDDVALLQEIAARGATTALAVATHIDVFERAVAAELAGRADTTESREGDLVDAARRLRQQLGFATLGPQDIIITTRELEPGMPVDMAGTRTTVHEVTEGSFTVRMARAPEVTPGAKIALSIVHLDEAKYFVLCDLLSAEPDGDGWRVAFGHDEHPARTQRRRYARVHPGGAATAEYGGDQGALGRPRTVLEGTLLDVGIGGAALQTLTPVEPRTRARATFSIGAVVFRDVEAVVLGCEGPPEGPYRVRLEFVRLPAEKLRRFGEAITRSSRLHPHVAPTPPGDG